MKKKTEIVSLRKGTSSFELNYADLRKAALVLKAVDHELRRRMIDLLQEHGPLNVTDIYVRLRLEESVASQQLGILRRAGFVVDERQGKFIYYALNKNRFNQIARLVEELAG